MYTVDYYLKKGFDKKTAEYFSSGRRRIVCVIPESNYRLLLRFDNGEERTLDIAHLIRPGTVFAFLQNPENFKRVYLDENSCVSWDIDPDVDSRIVWNNKVDLCPDSCYMDSILVEG